MKSHSLEEDWKLTGWEVDLIREPEERESWTSYFAHVEKKM